MKDLCPTAIADFNYVCVVGATLADVCVLRKVQNDGDDDVVAPLRHRKHN